VQCNIFSHNCFSAVKHLLTQLFQCSATSSHTTVSVQCNISHNCFKLTINFYVNYTLGKHHQHTFKNDMRVQLSLSLHFYLLYLLLNSCDGNYTFWCHSMLMKQSSSFSRKHRTLSLQICVCQTVQLTTEFVDWCRNVCTLCNHLSTTPTAVTSDLNSASLTLASISQNVID